MKPIFQHDCDQCKFLGCFKGNDLYYCDQHNMPTVIARYGNDGSSYKSGLVFAWTDSHLCKARDLAIEAGYIK